MVWRYPARTLAVAALVTAVLAPGHAGVHDRVSAARANSPQAYESRLRDAFLAAAAGATRTIEPRLTGGFAYAPWPIEASSPPSASLYAAAARLKAAADTAPRPDTLRALGVAYLLLGLATEARDTLEQALAAAPDDPRTLSDLSAALLARSRETDQTWEAVRALNYAERAWRLAPAMPEAAFNAALARERMHLRSEARKAWEAVRRLDPASPWAGEAARHLAPLSTDTIAQLGRA